MTTSKTLDLNELRDSGLLQEVNRRFFHPIGLALAVIFDEDETPIDLSIVDAREDPEGILYAEITSTTANKFNAVEAVMKECHAKRYQALGYVYQPATPEAIAQQGKTNEKLNNPGTSQ